MAKGGLGEIPTANSISSSSVLTVEWPEAFYVLDFEKRHLWNTAILLQHVQRAGLSALSPTGHACKVQSQIT